MAEEDTITTRATNTEDDDSQRRGRAHQQQRQRRQQVAAENDEESSPLPEGTNDAAADDSAEEESAPSSRVGRGAIEMSRVVTTTTTRITTSSSAAVQAVRASDNEEGEEGSWTGPVAVKRVVDGSRGSERRRDDDNNAALASSQQHQQQQQALRGQRPPAAASVSQKAGVVNKKRLGQRIIRRRMAVPTTEEEADVVEQQRAAASTVVSRGKQKHQRQQQQSLSPPPPVIRPPSPPSLSTGTRNRRRNMDSNDDNDQDHGGGNKNDMMLVIPPPTTATGAGAVVPMTTTTTTQEQFDAHFRRQEEEDRKFVEHFWTMYDDILILSLFTQVGIVFRLASSTFFEIFDGVFSTDSALFVNLPLNCLSCFIMGLLCSGERLMEIIATRFTPPRLQFDIQRGGGRKPMLASSSPEGDALLLHDDTEEGEEQDMLFEPSDHDDDGIIGNCDDDLYNDEHDYCDDFDFDDDDDDDAGMLYNSPGRRGLGRRRIGKRLGRILGRGGGRRRRSSQSSPPQRQIRSGARRAKTDKHFHHWEPPLHLNEELRDVQLLALERRIRTSKCLVLFPTRKEDVDVMEHYFQEGYKKQRQRQELREQRETTAAVRLEQDRHGIGYAPGAHDLSFDLSLEESTAPNEEPSASLPSSRAPGTPERKQKQQVKVGPAETRETDKDNSAGCDDEEQAHKEQQEGKETTPSPTPPTQGPGAVVDVDPLVGSVAEPVQAQDPLAAVQVPLHHNDSRSRSPSDNEMPLPPALGKCESNVTTGTNNTGNSVQQLHDGCGEGRPQADIGQIVQGVQANVSENISRLRRIHLTDGWDVGTTPEAMSDDLMLGLRDGFCGALSSFSSWNSAMVALLRSGDFGTACVGYIIGLQLPMIAYRFGQHVAVYIFIWRCRQETKRDERRGYGIRVATGEDSERENEDNHDRLVETAILSSPSPANDHSDRDSNRDVAADANSGLADNNSTANNNKSADDDDDDPEDVGSPDTFQSNGYHTSNVDGAAAANHATRNEIEERETASLRAIITALFIMAVVTQCTSLSFYSDPEDQQVALSLLFSPLGVLARWRLCKYNAWRPAFPIGTFTANVLACALSGSLGSLLAGNPGPRERIVLVSVVRGFGGTLSSLATFIVEILAGVDPVLFRFDGIWYAVISIFWAVVVGFVFSASADWADKVNTATDDSIIVGDGN